MITKSELFALCQDIKSLDVLDVHCSACDNAEQRANAKLIAIAKATGSAA